MSSVGDESTVGHSAQDRVEAVKRAGRVGWVGLQVAATLASPITDAHALQQAATDDPTLTSYREEIDRQQQKSYAEHRKLQDEKRAGIPQVQHERSREKDRGDSTSRAERDRRSERRR